MASANRDFLSNFPPGFRLLSGRDLPSISVVIVEERSPHHPRSWRRFAVDAMWAAEVNVDPPFGILARLANVRGCDFANRFRRWRIGRGAVDGISRGSQFNFSIRPLRRLRLFIFFTSFAEEIFFLNFRRFFKKFFEIHFVPCVPGFLVFPIPALTYYSLFIFFIFYSLFFLFFSFS